MRPRKLSIKAKILPNYQQSPKNQRHPLGPIEYDEGFLYYHRNYKGKEKRNKHILHGNINPTTKQQFVDLINQGLASIQTKHSVWKKYLYSNLDDRFVENGTLHTVPQTYSPDGIPTTILAAADCYLNITAFDAEAMQIGLKTGLQILGRDSKNDQGQPILPYQPNTDYLWLEALGGNYTIIQNGTRRLQDGNIQVTLGRR